MPRTTDATGFDTLDSPFPGGRIVVPQGNDRQLADLSIGLEATEITPLHAVLLAAVMANDGMMPVPTLVHAENGRLGFHPRRLSPSPGRRVVELRDLGRMAEQRGWLDDTDHVPGRDRIHRLAHRAPPEEDLAAPLPAR